MSRHPRERPIWDTSIDVALQLRWERGASLLRGNRREWYGAHPIVEMYEELLDAHNYLDQYMQDPNVSMDVRQVDSLSDLRVRLRQMLEDQRHLLKLLHARGIRLDTWKLRS